MQFQKQHDSNNLLNPNKHIDFLDNYCMDPGMLSNIKNAYYNYTSSEKLYLDMKKMMMITHLVYIKELLMDFYMVVKLLNKHHTI